jgi:Lon protease-like protein
MPMFPLGSVLLPGGVLPLHVFEPRYRALVRTCLEAPEHEFGVTLIERGREVGGGDQRAMVGTVARMVQVAETGDGRYAVICVGTRRIRVNVWLPDDPYPVADVDDWPDEDADEPWLAERIATTAVRVRRAAALASELGEPRVDAAMEISDDSLLATYHLAALAPIGAADAYRLLCARSPLERLDLLAEVLADAEAALEFRLNPPQ